MNKNVFYFKLYKIFFLTMLTDPVFVSYAYLSGLSANEIYILTSIETILIVLLEMPTGVITDLFGSKSSILSGIICYMLSNVIVLAAPSFSGFAGAAVFISLYKVLISGADETYLYLAIDHKNDYTKIAGMLDSISFILTGILSIGTGYIFAINKRYPFVLSLIVCGIAFIMAAKLENIREHSKGIKTLQKLNREFYLNIKNSFKIIFVNSKLKWFFLYSAVVSFGLAALMGTYQLFFMEQNIPVEYFGWIYFFLYITSSVSSKAAYYFKRFNPYKVFLMFLGMLALTPLLMMTRCKILIFVIILPRIVIGIYPAMIKEYINKEIVIDRATIFSIRSLLSRIPQIFLLPLVGSLIDHKGMNYSLLFIAIVLLAALCSLGMAKYTSPFQNH